MPGTSAVNVVLAADGFDKVAELPAAGCSVHANASVRRLGSLLDDPSSVTVAPMPTAWSAPTLATGGWFTTVNVTWAGLLEETASLTTSENT